RDREPALPPRPRRRVDELAAGAAPRPAGLLDAGGAQRLVHRPARAQLLRPGARRLVPAATRPGRPAVRADDGRAGALHAPRLLVPVAGDLAALAVALRLALDELEEARRVLERGEPRGRGVRAPRRVAQAADGRDRPRGPDEAAEGEGAQSRPAALLVHETIVRCA